MKLRIIFLLMIFNVTAFAGSLEDFHMRFKLIRSDSGALEGIVAKSLTR